MTEMLVTFSLTITLIVVIILVWALNDIWKNGG